MLKIGLIGDSFKTDIDQGKILDKDISSQLEFSKYKASINENSIEDFVMNNDAILLDFNTTDSYNYALKTLRNSKHLYISNTFKLDSKKAKEISKLSLEADVKLQFSRPGRNNCALLKAKEFIDNPLFIESHRYVISKDISSVIYDIMIDDIDIILNIIDSPVKNVFASGIDILDDKAAVINARIEFSNSCVANITAGNMSENEEAKIKLLQQGGSISIDYLENYLEIMKTDKSEMPKVKTEKIKLNGNSCHNQDLKNFIEAINNNISLENSISNYSKAIDLADEIAEKI